MISCVIPLVLLLLYIMYGIFRIKRSKAFGEYKSVILKNNSNISLIFQLTYFYMGLFIGLIIALFNTFKFISIAIAIIPLFLQLVTWAKPVFTKQYDKFRTQLNLLTIIFLQIPFIYANINP